MRRERSQAHYLGNQRKAIQLAEEANTNENEAKYMAEMAAREPSPKPVPVSEAASHVAALVRSEALAAEINVANGTFAPPAIPPHLHRHTGNIQPGWR
jgi:hypothetical protein